MKKIVTHPFALEEMVDLLEKGYHCAYTEDCGEYYTMLITNDNGKMKDEKITDRCFDFEYVKDMKNKINSLVGFVDSIIETVDSDITLDNGLTIGECWKIFVEPVLDMIKEN